MRVAEKSQMYRLSTLTVLLVSAVIAYVIFHFLGADHRPRNFFHQWFGGVSITFLVVFLISAVFAKLRFEISRVQWAFLTMALGYMASIVAYLGYFGVREGSAFFLSLMGSKFLGSDSCLCLFSLMDGSMAHSLDAFPFC